MSKSDELFSVEELMRFQAVCKSHVDAAAKAPLVICTTVLVGLVLAVVVYIEWEIVYRVFDYLAGDTNEYWSPTLMGLTAAIMIIGFHLLLKTKADNWAVKIVEKSVEFLIPLYLCGIGLLIAAILFADGLNSMVEIEMPVVIGAIPEAIEQGWVEIFFDHVTNPMAVLAFSIGIGGLAIVNIFVAHKLLTIIITNLEDVFDRISRAKTAINDHKVILRTQKEYSELGSELGDLLIWDDHYIRTIIANEVISVISDALLPHKKWLQDSQYSADFRFETHHQKADPKQIAKDIAKIEAIRHQDILNAMNPKLLEKKS
ncbi:MAG TPA: hypothetical protein PKJ85_08625 [Nitrosomonas nitrosa]|nr:hypothetical protein [Nitrosomonas nitrosa]